MMRNVLASMGLLSVLGFGSAGADQTPTGAESGQVCVLKVSGMACGACAARVEKIAQNIAGVKVAKVSQPKGTAEITYDRAKTTPEAIAKLIKDKSGFKAEVMPKDKKEGGPWRNR